MTRPQHPDQADPTTLSLHAELMERLRDSIWHALSLETRCRIVDLYSGTLSLEDSDTVKSGLVVQMTSLDLCNDVDLIKEVWELFYDFSGQTLVMFQVRANLYQTLWNDGRWTITPVEIELGMD